MKNDPVPGDKLPPMPPPADEWRGAPFWSWNGQLDPGRLVRQIEEMQRGGFGGFFMHSRSGLQTPYFGADWHRCIQACVAAARERGMKAFLYDEDRYASGGAGGAIVRDNPDFAVRNLRVRNSTGNFALHALDLHVASFRIELSPQGELISYHRVEDAVIGADIFSFDACVDEPVPWCGNQRFPDQLRPEVVDAFLEHTYAGYASYLKSEFGRTIPAVFTDEVKLEWLAHRTPPDSVHELAVNQWTIRLPEEFRRRRGYDLIPRLPEVFFSPPGAPFSAVRYDFRRTLFELFKENFSERTGRWCAQHAIILTGHYYEELESQAETVGAQMPHYEDMGWPGIDMLTDRRRIDTVKQASSVAFQLGKERVVSELYGVTGWDWPLSGHRFQGEQQYLHGINFRCHHLTHYTLAGDGKRDYPASIFFHSPWWHLYRLVEDSFARLGAALAQGIPLHDILVLSPIRSTWGYYSGRHFCFSVEQETLHQELIAGTQKLISELVAHHWGWDFGDEYLLEKYATLENASRNGLAGPLTSRDGTLPVLAMGPMRYSTVIIPPVATISLGTLQLLARFAASGGRVLVVGNCPSHVDGSEDPRAQALTRDWLQVGDDTDALLSALRTVASPLATVTSPSGEVAQVEVELRGLPDAPDKQILFIQSQLRSEPQAITVTLPGLAPVILMDPLSGEQTELTTQRSGDLHTFSVTLPPGGSLLASLGIAVKEDHCPGPSLPSHGTSVTQPWWIFQDQVVVERIELPGPFPISLKESLTAPLDYARYAFDDEPLSELLPILEIDRRLRERLGIPRRIPFYETAQPWLSYTTGAVDLSPRGRLRLVTTFHVSEYPAELSLALEYRDDYRLTLNGQPLAAPTGFWLDEDFKTIPLTSQLRPGENELLLECQYRADFLLEDMYLVGSFGVRPLVAGTPLAPATFTLTAPPRTLAAGSWIEQGLPFYSSGVRYHLSFPAPKRGQGVRLSFPRLQCTAAQVHCNGTTIALPWEPWCVDLTPFLGSGDAGNRVEATLEVIGSRRNILGPLHTVVTDHHVGPDRFEPTTEGWRTDYQLSHYGLMGAVLVESLS
ncbi:MAG: glycosyl hydrolase [Terrimicrobiaceae bacterium]